MTRAFTLAELDAALTAIGGFEPRPLVAVAVSGGPDSLALTILADRWARNRGGRAWGLIVDHRLRRESAAEAATVAGWLAARRIPHDVLVWDGDKPATGIQEAARAARYRLLAGWCAGRGCLHLLTAHHRDDQVETYRIRHRAGSGSDGLAGMPAVRELPHCRLVRPLLGVPKVRLVAFLKAERQPSIEDPSNRNPIFARARLRLGVERAAALHPDPLPAGAEIRSHAAARIARERSLGTLLASAVALHPAGFAAIDPAPIAAAELGERALGRVVAVLGGGAYPARRERLARLRAALGASPMRPRTLGGCRFVPWRGRVLALREAARAAPPLPLAPGMSGMWDQRFAVSMPEPAPAPVVVGALGVNGLSALPRNAIAAGNPLPRLAYPVLPAVWDERGLLAVPHLAWCRTADTPLPRVFFRPPAPLFGAGFTVV
ncbi:MAG TPA: tRNA lysidine(34) synthetase TilS [Stellaceae bacterium]|nr:tRNA lysidine(34) synthetase TilS [Stellaceae bacterium]